MKKLIVSLLAASLLLTACSQEPTTTTEETTTATTTQEVTEVSTESAGNYTDEMKIPYTVDLHEYGADSVERDGDHEGSPYFSSVDFYNATSTDTLTIISNFETQQQTSEWSCGVSSALMMLNHYDALGEHNEETLAAYRTNGMDAAATSLESLVMIFEEVGGFTVDSTYNYPGDEIYEYMTLDKIQELLAEGTPIAFAWNDWGGHWQVMIGYDNMGTETYQDDVIIVADPYDTTDHNQDGYGVYPAERLYYNWTMYDFFEDGFDLAERDMLFATITPIAE